MAAATHTWARAIRTVPVVGQRRLTHFRRRLPFPSLKEPTVPYRVLYSTAYTNRTVLSMLTPDLGLVCTLTIPVALTPKFNSSTHSLRAGLLGS